MAAAAHILYGLTHTQLFKSNADHALTDLEAKFTSSEHFSSYL